MLYNTTPVSLSKAEDGTITFVGRTTGKEDKVSLSLSIYILFLFYFFSGTFHVIFPTLIMHQVLLF